MVSQVSDTLDRVIDATDDGCVYHSKYVEQDPEINKLLHCSFLDIYQNVLTMHGQLTFKTKINGCSNLFSVCFRFTF
jgi:hypothetical protein